jgi:hypothetical protein
MSIPSDNKNQINRSRGAAAADQPFGFERKPMLDEHPKGGLRGQDKRQAALEDAAPSGLSHDVTRAEQRMQHEDAQPGADVRAPFIQAVDTLPEGLVRERTHALSPTEGRGGEVPAHVPSGKNVTMPKPPKPMTELDQAKAGLQDDHDPNDIGQQQNDKPKGDSRPPERPAGPYDRDQNS